MATERNIIVIAKGGDRPAGILLTHELDKRYNVESSLWSDNNYKNKQHQFSNSQVIICVGGPVYNKITKDYDSIYDITEKTKDLTIKIKDHVALIYGYMKSEDTKKAVIYFIDNYLKDFVESNFPKQESEKPIDDSDMQPDQPADTPKQPDYKTEVKSSQNETKPIEKKPNKIEEDKTKYKSELTYNKEFYKIGSNSWKIKYYDEENVFEEYTGLIYMHHILSNPEKNVKLNELYYLINPPEKDNILDDEDNENEAEMEEQDEIEVDISRDKVAKMYKKPDPLTQAGMENQRTKDVIAKEITDYKKGIKTLESLSKKFLRTIDEQTEHLSQLKRELEALKTIEKETRITRAGEKKKTVSEKLTAQENVTNKIKEIKDIENKIKFKRTNVVSNKDDITRIKKKINELAVELNKPTVETSKAFGNVRTSIINSIKYFKEKLELAGFNEFLKYWDVYVKKYNGYTYNPMDSESWKLVK